MAKTQLSKCSLSIELENAKPHPLYKITMTGEDESSVFSGKRYIEFKALFNHVKGELKEKKLFDLFPPFPAKYTKQSFGISLTKEELKDRSEKLEKWIAKFASISDDLTPETRLFFEAYLGSPISSVNNDAASTAVASAPSLAAPNTSNQPDVSVDLGAGSPSKASTSNATSNNHSDSHTEIHLDNKHSVEHDEHSTVQGSSGPENLGEHDSRGQGDVSSVSSQEPSTEASPEASATADSTSTQEATETAETPSAEDDDDDPFAKAAEAAIEAEDQRRSQGVALFSTP